MLELRDYQRRAVDMLYGWFNEHDTGNPVLCMPGGSGKSIVIATLAKEALTGWPETRILMTVRSKELVAQNAAELRGLWPGAPLGIYSASLRRRQLGEPILYAGIDSVAKRAAEIGHVDLMLVDEVQQIPGKAIGSYRRFIADLLKINPSMRIVGLSASPYRLGQGMVTEGEEAIFDDILEPVTIEELIFKKHLMPLRSKLTQHELISKGLPKSGGEFTSKAMENRFNTPDNNIKAVQEVIAKAGDRRHWLVFCAGKDHASNVAETFKAHGIPADFVTSDDGLKARDAKIKAFESGEIKALCNVGILTTGYNFPNLDLIAFLRATASPGLYLQMAVRGCRLKSHTDHCLVLDFAGVVETHGPITRVEPPKKKGKGEAPTKVCKECGEICHASAKQCPACGTWFETEAKTRDLELRNVDIMGEDPDEAISMTVKEWVWRKHTSATSGKDMLLCTYYGSDLMAPAVHDYLTVKHDGYAGEKAWKTVDRIVDQCRAHGGVFADGWLQGSLPDVAAALSAAPPPHTVRYTREGKFFRVLGREWSKK